MASCCRGFLVFVALCMSLYLVQAHEPGMVLIGGPTDERKATPEDQKIADKARDLIEAEAKQVYPEFTVTRVRTQVVAGTNYFMKIRVGHDRYIHARIFKSLPYDGERLSLHGLLLNKTKDEHVLYFQGF